MPYTSAVEMESVVLLARAAGLTGPPTRIGCMACHEDLDADEDVYAVRAPGGFVAFCNKACADDWAGTWLILLGPR